MMDGYFSQLRLSNKFFVKFATAFCALSTSCFAYSADPIRLSQSHLQQVSQTMTGIKGRLDSDKNQANTLENSLQSLETQMGQLNHEIELVNQSIQAEDEELQQLTIRQKNYEQALEQQRQKLIQMLQLSYTFSKENDLKTMLNQEHPENMDRYLQYDRYLNQARLALIQQIHQSLSELAQTENALAQKKNDLTQLKQKKLAQQANLRKMIGSRKQLIKNLQVEMGSSQSQLEQLSQSKKELEATLSKILSEQDRRVDQVRVAADQLKGSLAWPVKGKVVGHFNDRFENTEVTRNAVEISAPAGSAVHAVYSGQVVFSGWMRGIGLLVIVQHGKDFVSLYGHLQHANVTIGESIAAGTEIGEVGNSGGQNHAGLYFQLREDQKPLDPELWCH